MIKASSPSAPLSATRVYGAEQIRRVLDQGLRPGKVVALSEEALGDLDAVPAASSRQEATDPAHAALVTSASSGDIAALTETYFDGRNGGWWTRTLV